MTARVRMRRSIAALMLRVGLILASLWPMAGASIPTTRAAPAVFPVPGAEGLVPSTVEGPVLSLVEGSPVTATLPDWRDTAPPATKASPIPSASDPTHDHADQAPMNLPFSFIPNAGQTDPAVRFYVKGGGHTIFFTTDEVVFSTAQRVEDEESVSPLGAWARLSETDPRLGVESLTQLPSVAASLRDDDPGQWRTSVVRLRFSGANPNPEIRGVDQLAGIANFFIGDDPAGWHTNLPTYDAVAYRDLYPGIDLVYRGTEGRLKSEFLVAPGADPAMIRLTYASDGEAGAEKGAQALRLREDGALVLRTELGELIEETPVVYQEADGVKQEITGRYVIHGQDQIGFEIADYDPARPLVIDPVLSYFKRFGGGGNDVPQGIVVDDAGNAYVTGWTGSSDFPTTPDAFQEKIANPRHTDVFVVKMDAAGSVIYSTYLGGSKDRLHATLQFGPDSGYAIAVDASGNAYVTGGTTSTDFPTVNPIFRGDELRGDWFDGDAFVAKLNASGSQLLFSTYLGGSKYDSGQDIAVDSDDNVYVTGDTTSDDLFGALNTHHGGTIWGLDTFVARLKPGTLFYSTYLGGSDEDVGLGIDVDAADNVYVTGWTWSSNFNPLPHALQGTMRGVVDAFVTKLSPSGAVVFGTYLGGSRGETGNSISVDVQGTIHVTGATISADLAPTSALDPACGTDGNCNFDSQGYYSDAFVTTIVSQTSGYAWGYSTYLGGSKNDWANDITIDTFGSAHVTGATLSDDFPTEKAYHGRRPPARQDGCLRHRAQS